MNLKIFKVKKIYTIIISALIFISSFSVTNFRNQGNLKIEMIKYSSNYNPRRKDYNNSKINSYTINIENFIKLKKNYWGYDETQVPLNGYIWKPKLKGKYPVIFCIHGNHNPKEFSEPGYDYLGEYFASKGYIFISVDENFLNGNSRENDARAYVLLKNIEFIRNQNKFIISPLYNQIKDEIYLIGHSRGGEAVVHASIFNKLSQYPDNGKVKFNFNFPIKGVISLAPVADQYMPSKKLYVNNDMNYLLLQGSHDGDVHFEAGYRYFNYGKLDLNSYRFAIWILGANHAQFNSIWAKKQDPSPSLRNNLVSTNQQQTITKIFIYRFIKFLENKSKSHYNFLIHPNNYVNQNNLPKTRYINSYRNFNDNFIYNGKDDLEISSLPLKDWYLEISNSYKWKETPLYFNSLYNKYFNHYNWGLEIQYKAKTILKFYTNNNNISIEKSIAFDLINYSKSPPNYDIILTNEDNTKFFIKSNDIILIKQIPIIKTLFIKKNRRSIPQSITLPVPKGNYKKIEFIFNNNGYIYFDNLRYQ